MDFFDIFTKGQLISKCLFGVIVWTKKNNEILSRIYALAARAEERSEGKECLNVSTTD